MILKKFTKMKMYKCAAKSLSLEPSIPAFTPSQDWNILSSKKIRLCQLNQSFLYCLRSEIVLLRPEFYVVMLFLSDES